MAGEVISTEKPSFEIIAGRCFHGLMKMNIQLIVCIIAAVV